MASNLFGPGTLTGPSARQIKADYDRARAEDARQQHAAAAAGRDSRSIGVTRRTARDDTDEM
jgi:hypothetical protein